MDVVSFFAGCGGLDLGFEQAGFRVVWANEIDPVVRATYERNHPHTKLMLKDINNLHPEDIPDCDGFIGGPPCQSWSIAGQQKGLEDKRGILFTTYIELIKIKHPKFFLIENVKGILDKIFEPIFQMFLTKLTDTGYKVKWTLLDAANFGVPQNRERVFIIGFRNDINVNYEFPTATYATPISLLRAIGDIKENPVAYQSKDLVQPNPYRANHDVLNSDFTTFYNRGNRRRGWQQPSFTIHATADNIPLHPSSPKMMYFGHENWEFQKDKMCEYRRLSVRECARIQTFPDSFTFEGNDIKAQYKMVGNAVPPRLAKVLAQSILAVLKNTMVEPIILPNRMNLEECVLVGYFKDAWQHDCIINNKLYYVRSDGRPGSMFKESCEMMPKFLLMHHKEQTEVYELEEEEPALADNTYLQSLGFKCKGNTYLVFRIKDTKPLNMGKLVYNNYNYTPYFTTLGKLIVKE